MNLEISNRITSRKHTDMQRLINTCYKINWLKNKEKLKNISDMKLETWDIRKTML